MKSLNRPSLAVLLFLVLSICTARTRAQSPMGDESRGISFEVTLSPDFSRRAVSGRLYILFSSELTGEPRHRFAAETIDQVLVRDVAEWQPGTSVTFGSDSAAFPSPLAELKVGTYAIQAVLDSSTGTADIANADGNGRSTTLRRSLDVKHDEVIEIAIDREISKPKLRDVSRLRYHTIESRIAGRQLGHRVFMQVAVAVPQNYDTEKDRHYPVQFWIPEAGRPITSALHFFQNRGVWAPTFEFRDRIGDFVHVLAIADGDHGHHGFFDSPVAGSWSRAFVEEIVPFIESEYRTEKQRGARFLLGEGAGGLSAMWLLARHAETFDSAWVTSPDPVDFSSFFGLNLYQQPAANAYVNESGRPRPFRFRDGISLIDFKRQTLFEEIADRCGRLSAYDAAFSPPGADGTPLPLYDHLTGQVDPFVVDSWRVFDLRQHFEELPDDRRSDLASRIHIWVPEKDEYRRQESVGRLRTALDQKKTAIDIRVIRGASAAELESPAIQRDAQTEITERAFGRGSER